MWGERLYLLDAQSQRNLDNLKKKKKKFFSVITLEKPKDNKDFLAFVLNKRLPQTDAIQCIPKAA